MATGDTNDIVNRLRATLAPWFPDAKQAPNLTAVLTGAADAFSFVYSYLNFAALQTRIATATGAWLDLIAWDFFGARFVRRPNETDAQFQPRILQELLRPRATRAAILRMLKDLTGNTAQIYELWSTNDEGSYNTGTMGYGVGLGWGSLNFPYQTFISAYRPLGEGVPNIAGYQGNGGGYGVGSLAYIDISQVVGPVTDAEIYQRIAQTVAAGTVGWTSIQSPGMLITSITPPVVTGNFLVSIAGDTLTTKPGDSLIVSSAAPPPLPPPPPPPPPVFPTGPSITMVPGREFAANSFVHTPLDATTPIDPNSITYVNTLLTSITNNFGYVDVNIDRGTPPIWIVPATQPTVVVKVDPAHGVDPALQNQWLAVPLPANFGVSPAGDHEAVIYQPSTGTYWELWSASLTGSNTTNSVGQSVPEWQAQFGGQLTNLTTHSGYFPTVGGRVWGTTATSITFLAGIITIEEARAGVVNHALGFAVAPIGSTQPPPAVRWPAQRTDGGSFGGSTAIQAGMCFRLPSNLNLSQFNMDAWGLMIATAVQKYGMFIWDTSGVNGFRAENPGPYVNGVSTQYGPISQHPYYGVLASGQPGILRCPAGTNPASPPQVCWPASTNSSRMFGFPFGQLQVVAPSYFLKFQ